VLVLERNVAFAVLSDADGTSLRARVLELELSTVRALEGLSLG
jgi:hypothetical protein